MRVRSTTILFAGLISLASAGAASSANVPFQGVVTSPSFCAIIVNQNGTLEQDVGAQNLSSQFPGAQPGLARVISWANYEITAHAPAFWAVEPGPLQPTDFTAWFSGNSVYRGRNFPQREGSRSVRLRNGLSVTDVTVDLDAAAQSGGFRAGNYTAVVVLTCD